MRRPGIGDGARGSRRRGRKGHKFHPSPVARRVRDDDDSRTSPHRSGVEDGSGGGGCGGDGGQTIAASTHGSAVIRRGEEAVSITPDTPRGRAREEMAGEDGRANGGFRSATQSSPRSATVDTHPGAACRDRDMGRIMPTAEEDRAPVPNRILPATESASCPLCFAVVDSSKAESVWAVRLRLTPVVKCLAQALAQ